MIRKQKPLEAMKNFCNLQNWGKFSLKLLANKKHLHTSCGLPQALMERLSERSAPQIRSQGHWSLAALAQREAAKLEAVVPAKVEMQVARPEAQMLVA